MFDGMIKLKKSPSAPLSDGSNKKTAIHEQRVNGILKQHGFSAGDSPLRTALENSDMSSMHKILPYVSDERKNGYAFDYIKNKRWDIILNMQALNMIDLAAKDESGQSIQYYLDAYQKEESIKNWAFRLAQDSNWDLVYEAIKLKKIAPDISDDQGKGLCFYALNSGNATIEQLIKLGVPKDLSATKRAFSYAKNNDWELVYSFLDQKKIHIQNIIEGKTLYDLAIEQKITADAAVCKAAEEMSDDNATVEGITNDASGMLARAIVKDAALEIANAIAQAVNKVVETIEKYQSDESYLHFKPERKIRFKKEDGLASTVNHFRHLSVTQAKKEPATILNQFKLSKQNNTNTNNHIHVEQTEPQKNEELTNESKQTLIKRKNSL